MKTQIFEDYSAFLSREDKEVNGVSQAFADNNPAWGEMNETNIGCWNCTDCYGCSGCYGCYGCYGRSGCSGLQNNSPAVFEPVPEIPNIHQKVFEAASRPDGLNMGAWHTCDTTHCRAGWVVFLAGEEGKALEEQTSTLFAAMQIYRKSSDIRVSPPRFYDDNETAMADMKRCAELEAAKS